MPDPLSLLTRCRLLWLVVIASLALPTASGFADSQWFKGNTHVHSIWSDGVDLPEMVADWYKSNDFHFLVVTDHNILQVGEKWVPLTRPQTQASVASAQQKFGREWVQTRPGTITEKDKKTGKTVEREVEMVRARPLEEYRGKFEEPGRFILVMGEEITGRHKEGTPEAQEVHVNALNVSVVLQPQAGESVSEIIARDAAEVIRHGKETGKPTLAHLNHPLWDRSKMSPEDFWGVANLEFFEVCNGAPLARSNAGDGKSLSTDRLWDIVLARRLEDLKLGIIWGIGTDDSHNVNASGGAAYIMVRAAALDVASLFQAMRTGDFYATSGVHLKDVRRGPEQYAVEISPEPGATYRIQFIGTLRGYDRGQEDARGADGKLLPPEQRFGSQVGAVLKEVHGTKAAYKPSGKEIYVRAKIVRTSPEPANPRAGPPTAWTQPMVVRPAASGAGGQEP